MRLDVVAEPLMRHIRERFLAPERVASLVDKVNARINALAKRANLDAERAAAVAEVSRPEAEEARLVEALAKAYDAIQARLAEGERRLVAARARLAAVDSTPASEPARLTARGVTARLRAPFVDPGRLDADKAREALARIFDRIIVRPLDGSWESGWTLEMHGRPREEILRQGQSCQQLVAGAGF